MMGIEEVYSAYAEKLLREAQDLKDEVNILKDRLRASRELLQQALDANEELEKEIKKNSYYF